MSFVKNGVSEPLHDSIMHFMSIQALKDFSLGGGTNLALKYNHRESTDVDIFSKNVIGKDRMNEIHDTLPLEFGENLLIQKNNSFSNHLCFINAVLLKQSIKIQIKQNIKYLSTPVNLNGIRLIHDDDIEALKLLSASGRGVQKDFYDLYLLTEIKPLSHYYDYLMKYFEENKNAPENIFESKGSMDSGPVIDLAKDLGPLCNFSNAGNLKNQGNRIVFTKDSPVNISWPSLQENWTTKVVELAKEKGSRFKKTPKRRKRKTPPIKP